MERHLGLGAAQRAPSVPGRGELTAWLHALERGNDHVIYEADAEDTAWSRICLSQSDVVVLAASVTDDPSIGPVEARALATGSLRCELALLHRRPPRARPHGSKSAGGRLPPPAADQPGDVARLARMITGTGCGLVLGGGGARGLADLGVIARPLQGGRRAHRRRGRHQHRRGDGSHAMRSA